MSLKNLWTLNIDEALVADRLKNEFAKSDYEVFFPINAQTKDIDLLLVKLKGYKAKSIQVKGSRTYTPSASETEKYGVGSAAWFTLSKSSIQEPRNKIDFYIFVLHSFGDSEFKKTIEIDYLVVPYGDFLKVTEKKVISKGSRYHFFIWVDSSGKRAFDFNNGSGKIIPLSKYLNNWNLIK
jgi:hypothetical protein